MSPVTESHQAFHRGTAPLFDLLTAEQLLQLSQLQANSLLASRLEELAEKANEDELTDSETAEYEAYLEANHLLAVLRAEARFRLTRAEVVECHEINRLGYSQLSHWHLSATSGQFIGNIVQLLYAVIGIGGTVLIPVFVSFATWPIRPTSTQFALGFGVWLFVLVPITIFYLRWVARCKAVEVPGGAREPMPLKDGEPDD